MVCDLIGAWSKIIYISSLNVIREIQQLKKLGSKLFVISIENKTIRQCIIFECIILQDERSYPLQHNYSYTNLHRITKSSIVCNVMPWHF